MEEVCVFCGEEGDFEDGLRCTRCAAEQDEDELQAVMDQSPEPPLSTTLRTFITGSGEEPEWEETVYAWTQAGLDRAMMRVITKHNHWASKAWLGVRNREIGTNQHA